MILETEVYQENKVSEEWRKQDTERMRKELNINRAEIEELSARIKQGDKISFESTAEASKVLTALELARGQVIQAKPRNEKMDRACENLKRIVGELKNDR